MSLACALYFGVPVSVAGTPRFRARRAARLACQSAILRVLEHRAEIIGGGVEAFVVENLGEGHIDVEIVLVERVLDMSSVSIWAGLLFDDLVRDNGTRSARRS